MFRFQVCFMCGRYTYFPGEFSDLRLTWNVDEFADLRPRYNIAPSQEAPVIVQVRGKRSIELFRWGLIPWWAKDPAIGNKMINARSETLAEKAAFKGLLKDRRCLVLADGFFEWRNETKRKVPMLFKLKSGGSFTFAGLWDSWKQPDGNLLRTYTIVTTEPNDVLRPIHNRMPAMLKHDDALKWLAVDDEIAHALSLLKPYLSDDMEGYDVSPLVNDPRNDSPECIRPIAGLNRDDGTLQRLLDFR
jgi:putative SOS response-associated peptidase YedK